MKLGQRPGVGKVALAYSGGLDSILCIKLLADYYAAEEIVAVLVDVGQGEQDIAEAQDKLGSLDVELVTIDARREYINEWVSKAIRANGRYGAYPLSSSMTRQLIAAKVAEIAVFAGCDAVAEGSTGKGNDQFRFHNVFRLKAPELRVVTPIREFDLSRIDERALAERYGLPFYHGISDDKTAWGRAIGSGEVDDLDRQVDASEFLWWVPPQDAPAVPSLAQIEFQSGVPVRIDDIEGTASVIEVLNEIGGRNGIGMIDTLEDGILGLKSREIYEAPAATILLEIHRDLERLCLTKEELEFKQLTDARWSELVYHGKWFHPLKDALDAFVAHTQRFVEGTVTVALYKGGVRILGRQSRYSLFNGTIRSIERDSFDQSAMEAVVEAYTMSYRGVCNRTLTTTSQPPHVIVNKDVAK